MVGEGVEPSMNLKPVKSVSHVSVARSHPLRRNAHKHKANGSIWNRDAAGWCVHQWRGDQSCDKCVIVRIVDDEGLVGISSIDPSTRAKSPHTAPEQALTLRESVLPQLKGLRTNNSLLSPVASVNSHRPARRRCRCGTGGRGSHRQAAKYFHARLVGRWRARAGSF